jgi:hypothetical protein
VAIARAVVGVVRVYDAIAKNQNVNLAIEGLVLDVAHALAPAPLTTAVTAR